VPKTGNDASAKASLLTVIIISGIFGAVIGALVRRRRHGAKS
jgi:hypothetical protein